MVKIWSEPQFCLVSHKEPSSSIVFLVIHTYDISTDTGSEIRLFAYDCVCYRGIRDAEDSLKFQKDTRIQWNLNSSKTYGPFIMANANSFLSPYTKFFR